MLHTVWKTKNIEIILSAVLIFSLNKIVEVTFYKPDVQNVLKICAQLSQSAPKPRGSFYMHHLSHVPSVSKGL